MSDEVGASRLRIADALHDYEHLLDELVEAGGRLASAVVGARRIERISPTVVAGIHAAIAEAQGHVAGAQGSVARGHRLVSVVAEKFGIDPAMFGDGRKDPDDQKHG